MDCKVTRVTYFPCIFSFTVWIVKCEMISINKTRGKPHKDTKIVAAPYHMLKDFFFFFLMKEK